MINLTVKLDGDFSPEEKLEAQYIVGLENKRRAGLEVPDPALLTEPDADLLLSYESVLLAILSHARESYSAQATSPEALKGALTEAELRLVSAAVIEQLRAGETADALVLKIQAAPKK